MSIDIGIIGLPQSGKTTIFNALTRGKADSGSQKGLASHVGIARVPEPRLKALADILHPGKVVSVEAKYTDIGASARTPQDRGISGELLNQLGTVDALTNVVRAFADASIPHPRGSVDVERDIAAMELELVFSDLSIIERRLERVTISLKSAKPADRPPILREQEILNRLKAELEKDVPVSGLALNPSEEKLIANFQLLSAKPLLLVVNIGEDQLPEAAELETKLQSRYAQGKRRVIALCGKLEMELAQLEDSAAGQFRAEFGIKESGLERTIKLSYELLGLITFFTIASNEVRAWSIPGGSSAPKAAGKIHSDMERGFIRAEVISFDDLVKVGSLAEARKKGLLRLEGKDYIVQEGDVITFLFNV